MRRTDDDAVATLIRAFDADMEATAPCEYNMILDYVGGVFMTRTSQERQRLKNHFRSEHKQLYIKVLERTLDQPMRSAVRELLRITTAYR